MRDMSCVLSGLSQWLVASRKLRFWTASEPRGCTDGVVILRLHASRPALQKAAARRVGPLFHVVRTQTCSLFQHRFPVPTTSLSHSDFYRHSSGRLLCTALSEREARSQHRTTLPLRSSRVCRLRSSRLLVCPTALGSDWWKRGDMVTLRKGVVTILTSSCRLSASCQAVSGACSGSSEAPAPPSAPSDCAEASTAHHSELIQLELPASCVGSAWPALHGLSRLSVSSPPAASQHV